MTTLTGEPETNLSTGTPPPTGDLEITVSRAEFFRELTAAQSVRPSSVIYSVN